MDVVVVQIVDETGPCNFAGQKVIRNNGARLVRLLLPPTLSSDYLSLNCYSAPSSHG